MAMAQQRLQKEFQEFIKDPPACCTAKLVDSNNYFKWEASIKGPLDSPFIGGVFKLELVFPSEYPLKPPTVKFITLIFHPNVSQNGGVCLDILQKEWSPALTASKILLSIISLLSDPNAENGYSSEQTTLFLKDRDKYNSKAREQTKLNAMQ